MLKSPRAMAIITAAFFVAAIIPLAFFNFPPVSAALGLLGVFSGVLYIAAVEDSIKHDGRACFW